MGITTKNDLAQERYQDLIEYFGDEEVAKIILGNRGQFKAWLERLRWHVKRSNELARELEQLKRTTNNDLAGDCIRRQEVLQLLANSIGKTNTYLQTEVLRMSSVTPQEPKWIPVSERLPEESVKVLVQSEDVYYNIGENSNGIIIGWRNGQYWSTYTVKGIEFIKYPVAWMPLPESYKAKSEGEKC